MPSLTSILYIEVNVICILLLAVLSHKLSTTNNSMRNHMLVRAFLTQDVFYLLDILWALVDGKTISWFPSLNTLINVFYFAMSAVCVFTWFEYTRTLVSVTFVNHIVNRILCLLPAAAIILMAALSPLTGWLFNVDPVTNTYSRGSLYILQPLVSFGYLIASAVWAFLQSRRIENYMERHLLLSIVRYTALPLLGGVLQVLLPGVPVICVGITLALVIVYVNAQEHLITRDSLTQLNNRYRLMNYLEERVRHYREEPQERSLYLLIMDVDDFKQINDNFGHLEGDHALELTAQTLKQICGRRSCFAARYGGDEFVVVFETAQEAVVQALCRELRESIAAVDTGTIGYRLSISLGCSRFDSAAETSADLIAAADKRLYGEKAARKTGR